MQIISSEISPDENQKNLRVNDDKAADIKRLVEIIKQVDVILSLTEATQALPEKLSEALLAIAQLTKTLAWNNKSGEHIRNRYGKKNYSSNNNNANYIDWELLSAIEHLFNDNDSKQGVVLLFTANLTDFTDDLMRLRDSLKWIIKKEKPSIDQLENNLSENVAQLSLSAIKMKKIANLQRLPLLLHYFYDRLLFREIQSHCRAEQVMQLCSLPVKEHDRMRRYQVARIITSIGEAAKNLSDTCKRNYGIMPLDPYSKVRNKIAHKHRKYVLNKSLEVYAAILGLVGALPQLDKLLELLDENYTQFVPDDEDPKYQAKLWHAIKNFMSFDYAHRIPYYCQRYFDSQATSVQTVIDHQWSIHDVSEYDPAMLLPVRAKRFVALRAELKKLEVQAGKANLVIKNGRLVEKVDLQSKLQRTQDRLQALKQKTVALTEDEQKIVGQCQKAQPKIQAAIEAAGKARAELNLAEILKQYHANEAETEVTLLLLDVARNYGELQAALVRQKRRLTKPKEGEHVTKQQKIVADLRYKIGQLDDEIQFLSKLLRQQAGKVGSDKRLYAVEHALSVVGQCFRDLDDLNSELYTDLLNDTVQGSIASTVQGRNKLIMHSLFANHADKLMTLSVRQTLPITDDVNAMNVILNTDPSKYTEELSLKMTEALNNIGFAFLRLGDLEQAEAHFRMAVGTFLRSHYSSSYELPEEQVLRVTDFSNEQELEEFVQRAKTDSKRYVIYIPDVEEIFIQVQLYSNLSSALHLQDRYDEAFVWLEQCFEMTMANELHQRADYPWNIMANYVGLLFHRNDPRAEAVLEIIRQHLGPRPQQLNVLWINLAVSAMKKQKFEQGLSYLENIDVEQSDNAEVKLEFYRTRGGLRSARTAGVTDSNTTDVALFEKLLAEKRQGSADFQKALDILHNQRHELIQLRGDQMRRMEENLRRNVDQQTASLAASLGNYCLVLTNVGNMPAAIAAGKEAIALQEEHQIDASITYNNLARAFRTNAFALRQQAPNELINIFKSEQDAIELYTKNIECPNFVTRFTAVTSIGFIHEALFEYNEAIEWVLRGYELSRGAKKGDVMCQHFSGHIFKEQHEPFHIQRATNNR